MWAVVWSDFSLIKHDGWMRRTLPFLILLCSIFATINCGTEEVSRTVDASPTFCERKFQVASLGLSASIQDHAAVNTVRSACNELGGVGDRDVLAEQIISTRLNRADHVLWQMLDNCGGSHSVNPRWSLQESVANCWIERALANTEAADQFWAEVEYYDQLCKDSPRSIGCLEIKRFCRNLEDISFHADRDRFDPYKPRKIYVDPLCTQLKRKGVKW